jgi:hypothetical protein
MTKLQDDFKNDRSAARAFVAKKWEALGNPEASGSLGTEHLPREVVEPDVYVYAAVFTDPEDSRAGISSMAIRYGDLDNPDLTRDQAEYVVGVMLDAARKVAERYIESE